MTKKPRPEQKPIESEVNDLFSMVSGKVKAAFLRLGFHFIALMSGVLITITVEPGTFPHLTEEESTGSLGILIYLSLIAMFPRRYQYQRENVGFAMLSSVVWLMFGPWQLAIIWGALTRILLDVIINRASFNWRKIAALFLAVVILVTLSTLYPLSSVSFIFWLLFVVLLVIGCIAIPIKLRRDQQRILQQMEQPGSEINKNALIEQHTQLMNLLLRQGRQLPTELGHYVAQICEQSRLILLNMQNDPRDLIPGDKFLKRYLPAVQKIVTQHQKLSNAQVDSPEVVTALADSELLLSRLNEAFSEQQRRLLANDAQDLTIELNLLDKLLKMEGYK